MSGRYPLFAFNVGSCVFWSERWASNPHDSRHERKWELEAQRPHKFIAFTSSATPLDLRALENPKRRVVPDGYLESTAAIR